VLRIISPDILHKTDVGGVVVGLSSIEAVEAGYHQIMENARARRPDAKISGMLIQKMAPESTEVIVGSLSDSQFGSTILFGLGGIFVEVLEDMVFRIAPLEEHDAREMIPENRCYPLIMGRRGPPPADQDAIVEIILNTPRMVIENPQIAQMDLNPVMVCEHEASVFASWMQK
jgi:acetyl-CoA synthetase (ADP-forming)